MATRILFVDDEAGIRNTLKPILEQHGFTVTTAATVHEALEQINHATFEVLLSDLNIGQPGDGFTVVSAMRRVQPEAATFILTIESRLEHRRQVPLEQPLKRVSHLMQESIGEITREWLKLVKAHAELAAIRLSDKD